VAFKEGISRGESLEQYRNISENVKPFVAAGHPDLDQFEAEIVQTLMT
jgi:hypothetical protein